MAITNYSELVAAVENWLSRADLSARIPEFITLAESRFYSGSNPLRLALMQSRDTGTTSSGSITIPTGYLETIRLASSSSGNNYQLEYLSPDVFTQYESIAGIPYYYTLLNNSIKTAPNNDVSYIHDYYAKLTALDSTNTTNAILTNYPNIYLYGALLEATPYIQNDSRINVWLNAYNEAISGANNAEKRKFEATAPRVILT